MESSRLLMLDKKDSNSCCWRCFCFSQANSAFTPLNARAFLFPLARPDPSDEEELEEFDDVEWDVPTTRCGLAIGLKMEAEMTTPISK